jgi:hypothetical protein
MLRRGPDGAFDSCADLVATVEPEGEVGTPAGACCRCCHPCCIEAWAATRTGSQRATGNAQAWAAIQSGEGAERLVPVDPRAALPLLGLQSQIYIVRLYEGPNASVLRR